MARERGKLAPERAQPVVGFRRKPFELFGIIPKKPGRESFFFSYTGGGKGTRFETFGPILAAFINGHLQ
jgi:hypothetical protein